MENTHLCTNLYRQLLGNAIKKIRNEQNVSQKALAERILISKSTVSYIEKGLKSPTIDMLLKICDGLSISIVDLLKAVEDRRLN